MRVPNDACKGRKSGPRQADENGMRERLSPVRGSERATDPPLVIREPKKA